MRQPSYNILSAHKIPFTSVSADLDVTDDADYVRFPAKSDLPNQGAYQLKPAAQGSPLSPWVPFSVTSWGISSGTFMTFSDTNVLLDIEIRMMLARYHPS